MAAELIRRLPGIRAVLSTDVEAAYLGDPAAGSFGEVISCYPVIKALTNYRVAHDTGESHISLSICNLYNRQNVSDIYIGYDDNRTVLKGVCMFPFMPSLSYMFKF